MNIPGTAVLTWGLEWQKVIVTIMHSYNSAAKSLKSVKSPNLQKKMLNLLILEIPMWIYYKNGL